MYIFKHVHRKSHVNNLCLHFERVQIFKVDSMGHWKKIRLRNQLMLRHHMKLVDCIWVDHFFNRRFSKLLVKLRTYCVFELTVAGSNFVLDIFFKGAILKSCESLFGLSFGDLLFLLGTSSWIRIFHMRYPDRSYPNVRWRHSWLHRWLKWARFTHGCISSGRVIRFEMD